MTPELITALFTGAVGVVGALSAFTANRSKQIAIDQKTLRSRVRALERQNIALLRHVHRLEVALAGLGADVPDRPSELDEPLVEEDK